MRPFYAANARALLDTRQRGMAPSRPVVVSMIGGEYGDIAGATLYLHDDMPIARMDWRMLVNLQVWLWADKTVTLPKVLTAADGIARARPKSLHVRFTHPYRYSFEHAGQVHDRAIAVHDVEVGEGRHMPAMLDMPEVHEFEWSPVNVIGTPLGAKLRKALVAKHPTYTRL